MNKDFIYNMLWYISPNGISTITKSATNNIFNGNGFVRMRKYISIPINEIFCNDGIFPAIHGRYKDKYKFLFFNYETSQGAGFLQFDTKKNSFVVKEISPKMVVGFLLDYDEIDNEFIIPIMFSNIEYQKEIVKYLPSGVFKILQNKYPLIHAILHRTNTEYSIDVSNDDINDKKYTIIINDSFSKYIILDKTYEIYIPVAHYMIGGLSL